jgi:hypothetical protein
MVILAGLLAVVCGLTPAEAEGDGTASSVNAHIDVFPLFFDIFSGGAEFALPIKNFSIDADIQYSPDFLWVTSITLLDVTAKVRYYFGDFLNFSMPDFLSFLKKGAMAGPFVGIGGSYNSLSESFSGVTWSASTVGFIGELGTKYFFNAHWFAEGTVGVDIQSPTTWKVSGGGSSTSFSGTAYSPSAVYSNVSFGYAF